MFPVLIGTSGYDYPEWKGVFYPQDLKRKDFLSYYATQFNALELNSTFYNMPTAERLYSFYQRSEGRIQFSIKANRLLTHETDSTWQTTAEDFKTALIPLEQKGCLSAVLFQMPESFHYTRDNRIYLANLIQKFEGFPVMIEFRHKEWIKDSVFEGLEKRNAGIVFCDMPRLKNLPDGTLTKTPFIGNKAYLRLHGRNASAWYAHAPKAQTSIVSTHANGAKATYAHAPKAQTSIISTHANGAKAMYAHAPKAQTSIISTHANGAKATSAAGESPGGSARYCYDYSENELTQFVPIINAAVREGKKVQVYFNNHPNGSGAKNGLKLKEMILKH
ncbi:DUF72 domain-containing protein [Treponema rectale]|nr:DUF72 domain-containing protein [Treponema rectale]